MEPEITIVVAVHNRERLILRALESIIRFTSQSARFEVVIVDDGSTDDSATVSELFLKKMSIENTRVTWKVIRNNRNRGVAAAKTIGGLSATSPWILFLDSDDELVANRWETLKQKLNSHKERKLHFFRSKAASGSPEPDDSSYSVGINELLGRWKGGEALPVVSTEVFKKFPYDEDIRGYESISYLRIMKECGDAVLHSDVLRIYHTDADNRLSSSIALKSRSRELIRGHIRVLNEHWGYLSMTNRARQIARIILAVGRTLLP